MDFEQAVKYFMDAGGLDHEAKQPTGFESDAKISYITGKWPIMHLVGGYTDPGDEGFRLGQFRHDLIKSGSLPV